MTSPFRSPSANSCSPAGDASTAGTSDQSAHDRNEAQRLLELVDLPGMDGRSLNQLSSGQKEILAKLAAEDDATVGRVFAGVIMGFVPTLDGNLRATMAEWLRLAEYGRLRAAWAADAGGDPLLKARALVLPALTAAMQFKPAPELIWRTAARDHDRIGGEPLRQGDVVIAALVSASQRRRETGSGDVKAIFGMRAPDLPAAPGQAEKTMHSCPGYEAAMGVLLGALSAVVGYPEVMKPAPAALSFTLEGAMS